MRKSNKVFVVGGDHSVKTLFNLKGWINVDNVGAADLVCFTGGADVSPDLYNHPKHQSTFCDPQRDAREIAIFENCVGKDTPMVGICRGGQFLNVMNGGEMYQDVTNHTTSHPMFVMAPGGGMGSFRVTSTHHQMMKPHPSAKILATGPSSEVTWWDLDTEEWKTKKRAGGIEVVRYKNSLCFQPHPEFSVGMGEYAKMRDYFFSEIARLMSDDIPF